MPVNDFDENDNFFSETMTQLGLIYPYQLGINLYNNLVELANTSDDLDGNENSIFKTIMTH